MTRTLRVEAFGVRFELACAGIPDDAMAEVYRALPPGWTPTELDPGWRVGIARTSGDWVIETDQGTLRSERFGHFLHRLESDIALRVAEEAPGLVFVHAGVVGTQRGAIVLPGTSYAGKTTLVAALLRRGCTYLSDEYAVFEPDGSVRPYPRRLSIRAHDPDDRIPTSAAALGAATADRLPVAAVVQVSYQPGASYEVTTASSGQMAMALVGNAIAAIPRGPEVMATCATVARRALGLSGTRGEADEAARRLLASVANG